MFPHPLAAQNARVVMHERHLQAEVDHRARRLVTVRRLSRQTENVGRRVRLARLSLRQT